MLKFQSHEASEARSGTDGKQPEHAAREHAGEGETGAYWARRAAADAFCPGRQVYQSKPELIIFCKANSCEEI